MATWHPINNAPLQYAKNAGGAAASNYYIKLYASGTTTPINMASASDGSGLLAKCQLDTLGYPINGSSDIFIPHINQSYKIALFPTEADADANNFANAVWNPEVTLATDNRILNVKDYGAEGDGVTNDVAAFQSNVDAFTDGQIAVIHVPSGSYAGDFSTLTTGTRAMVYQEEGDVIYTGTAPSGNRVNAEYGSDATRPWFIGENGFIDNTTDGSSTDRPTLRAQRVADHTGGVVTTNAAAVSAQTTINQTGGRVDNYENAVAGQVDSYRSNTTTGSPNISVFQGTCFKHNESTGGFFGANFVARDQTKRATSVSKGGLVGCEIDVVCSGPDDLDQRTILDVIGRGYDGSVDGATSIHAGVLVRPANAGVLSPEPVNLEFGVKVEEGSLGSVTNCYSADGGATGLILTGTYTSAAVETFTEVQSVVRLGSKVKTAGQVHSQVALSGYNASDAKVNYTSIQSVVQVSTTGSENGRLDIRFKAAGSDVTGIQLSGNSAANPVFMYVDSSLRQVTAGANDSAGAGFRQLRVPN